MNEYNYLGIVFNYNAKFNVAKQNLYQKGNSYVRLTKKNNKLSLPVDVAVKLFTHLVKPVIMVILYSSEVWGDGKCNILEKLQLKSCKYILAVNKSTCSNMVYGELVITPLDIDIKARMIVYWAKLVNEDQSKILHMIYTLLYKLDEFNIFTSNWLSSIRCTLNDSGFSGIWLAQSLPCSVSTFRNILKLRWKDQFIQKWHECISENRKCIHFRIFKNHFKLEKYLVDLPDNLRTNFNKIQVSQSPSAD